ncbi:MAG: hypothetical protein NC924_00005, partial [Candidatus Omnitrophica bacterium]|nr:hypothetical protein [Candidatus Omnitrophota bacterium]
MSRKQAMTGIRWFGAGLLLVSCLLALWCPPAQAVQLKRVQTGDVYFDIDDATVSVPINQLDQTKSLIFVYPNVDTNTSNFIHNSLFSGIFESDTSLIISRDYGNASANVRFYILEFEDGVFVQRGFSSMVYGPTTNTSCTTKDVVLPTSVDATKSFVLVNTRWYNAQSDDDESVKVTGHLTDDNTLQLKRDSSYDYNRILNIVWQVAEFSTDTTIRTGEVTLDETELSDTGTITPQIPAGKVNKCLLL